MECPVFSLAAAGGRHDASPADRRLAGAMSLFTTIAPGFGTAKGAQSGSSPGVPLVLDVRAYAVKAEHFGTGRLIHDAAYALALRILGTIQHLLREEERRDAFREFYTAGRDTLEAYEVHADRMRRRLGGSGPGAEIREQGESRDDSRTT